MQSNSESNHNARIEALRKREQALKNAIAAEKIRIERRREKEKLRHAMILGTSLLSDLDDYPQMKTLLQEILQRHSNPRDAEFLRAQGWDI
jgi:uncharacterized membrane protein